MCSKTEEDYGIINPELVDKVLGNGRITITQKLDGHSCTIIIENKTIKYVCSRRSALKENTNNKFWQVAKKINLSKLTNDLYVLQGELMGPGLINNQLNLKEPELFVFQIKINDKFLTYLDMVYECRYNLNCNFVPHVENINTQKNNLNINILQDIADKQTLPDGSFAEGIIVRPFDYQTGGNGRPLGFKIISSNYMDYIDAISSK